MPQCAWREGCTEAAVENKSGVIGTLCQAHGDEAIRLRKIKTDGWAAKKEARDRDNLAATSLILAAEKDALFTVAQQLESEEVPGEITVTAVVQRGALMNFLLGANKGYVAQPGWDESSGTARKDLAGGLSLAAARMYANEFNSRLESTELQGKVQAVVRV